MDSDEFDDDIADEDLHLAFTQSAGVNLGSSASAYASESRSNLPTNHSHQQLNPDQLQDLLEDAFSSSPEAQARPATAPSGKPQGLTRQSSATFRQINLFGQKVAEDPPRPSQVGVGRVYRGDKNEPPCQHALNHDALQTWVYPKNLGAVRDYQYTIVKNGLFNNTLVALPTGLGKTFIAATVMLNFYRWTKTAKIIFVAPTKPLVAQQVDACFNIVGIARSDTTVLTGESAPALRAEEWQTKRVFFMTPQTLLNDISRGFADPKSIVLLVVDEAHRSTGEYAYAKVVKQIRRFNPHFRVLALTATPGSKVETVQEVMDNLGISHTEIRTEHSMDIRQYVHSRHIDQHLLDPSDEMQEVKSLFTQALKPLMEKLSQQNIYYGRDPMAITTFGLMNQEKEWFQSVGRNKPYGLQSMIRTVFAILKSLAHSIKLLSFHGIKPFYENLKEFRSEVEEKGEKGSKYKKQIIKDSSFQEMMGKIESWLRIPDFVGHPKLEELANTILNHFMDAQARGQTASRAIVFSEYRDSAEEIVRALNTHKPMIKASVFVGQAESKRSAGMKQADQIRTVENFKKGDFNVLVATSIGEEGLDIGQVDLIVCYDASSSPIRMLQRMGRTGRKREGNVVLLLMKGKEEENFTRAKDNYEEMQKLICEGSKFNFRHDLSTRIIPRNARPEVDMQFIDIPVENTQNPSLPEPGKRKARTTKKLPPKKFHMPDGVETGFVKASRIGQPGSVAKRGRPKKMPSAGELELEELADIPPLSSVVLTPSQLRDLDRTYRQLPGDQSQVEEAALPDLAAYPVFQRQQRPVARVKHGQRSRDFVRLMQAFASKFNDSQSALFPPDPGSAGWVDWKGLPAVATANDTDDELEPEPKLESTLPQAGKPTKKPPQKPPQRRQHQNKRVSATAFEGQQDRVGPQKKKRRSNGPSVGHFFMDSAAGGSGGASNSGSDTEASEDEGSQDGEEPMSARGPGRPPKNSYKKAPKKKKKKKQNRANMRGVNSDELGDDCERDTDEMDTDGSDSGGDLVDFIVGSDVPMSSMPASSTLPTSPTSSPVPVRSKCRTGGATRKTGPGSPTELPATQESMGDFPDLEDLASSTTRKEVDRKPVTGVVVSDTSETEDEDGSNGIVSDEEDVEPRKKAAGRLPRRRALIEESDESEEEFP